MNRWLTVYAAILGLYCIAAAEDVRPLQSVWISTLDVSKAHQGYGITQSDQSIDRHPISIAGQHFVHGIGTHSIGRLEIDLHGDANRFHAAVGIDDDAKVHAGTAEFSVIADGKQIYTSGIVRRGEPARVINLDVTGVKQLQLRVGDAGDGFENDHADWADATIDYNGEKPNTVDIQMAQPTIAMQPAPDAPAINNAEAYGGAPDTPLLLAVAATGKSPLNFRAQLPPDLSIDAKTGIINGTMPASRTLIDVTVANSAGEAKQQIVLLPTPAITPPLGWNSYDAYGDSVTEAEMLTNARAIAEHLRPHGWQYVVVDYRWYDPGAHDNNPNGRANVELTLDANGRLMPSANRFPSAANGAGFKPLADQIHAMGLRFGIHIMRGIPRMAVKQNLPIAASDLHAADAADTNSTCAWCPDMFGVRGETPAGQAYYDSLFKLYAGWGLDFVKVDDLSRPYATNEVTAIRNAIEKCGRTIVFSTSPGAAPLERAQHLKDHANMWRATDDFWDNWGQLSGAMDVCASWNGHGGRGHWPDMDMLPIGRLSVGHRSVGPERMTLFTHGEQLTLLTLWSIFPSPLMLGGDFSSADPWEISLLTNDEVLAINQDTAARPAMRAFNRHGLEVWQRTLTDGKIAVAFFNRTEDDTTVAATWADLDLQGAFKARDVWMKKDLADVQGKIELPVPSHSAAMVVLIKKLD
jgi:hypothetical protein